MCLNDSFKQYRRLVSGEILMQKLKLLKGLRIMVLLLLVCDYLSWWPIDAM